MRPILVVALALALAGPAAAFDIAFQYDSPGAGQVFLAGSFNGWSTSANPMSDDGDGLFTLTLDLAPGVYEYKFVVDGTWTEDPDAISFKDDGFGGKNSILEVLADGSVKGGRPAAQPAAEKAEPPAAGEGVTFRLEPKTGGVGEVFLAGSFNDWSATADRMTDEDGDGIYEISKNLAPGEYAYKFVVDGNWISDENAADFVDDGFGGLNSVILVGGAEAGPKLRRVPFIFESAGSYGEVFLAGSFNDWNVGKTRMQDDDGDGTWETVLLLPPGEHLYKFVADGNWITDQDRADSFVDDGFGGKNSVVNVDDRFGAVDRKRGDGRVERDGLRFQPDFPFLNRLDPETLEINFYTAAGDVESVTLMSGAEWERPMEIVHSGAAQDLWRYVVETPAKDVEIKVCFRIEDGGDPRYFGRQGVQDEPSYILFALNDLPGFYTPDWVRDGVFYQIFPDRFFNGDPGNDPDFSEDFYSGLNELPASGKTNGEYFHLEENWNDYRGLTRSPYRTDGKPDYYSFYGGDVEGVRQKLDYLDDLGVTIIYFNPVTLGKSNHKYDAGDYMTLDPHFGSQEDWLSFIREAHSLGIRVIVEAVYNHCGDTHWAFRDCVEKGPDSPYWEWFEWKKWPLPKQGGYKAIDYYDCWWGFGLHPNLNFDRSRPNAEENGIRFIANADPVMPVANHLLEATEFWLREMEVDGFRMDVPNEVPFWFWKMFRERVRKVNPDAYLVGELWSTAPEWVGPETFDAVMNYRHFKDPVNTWIGQGRGSAQVFEAGLAPGRVAYPSQAVQVMMNLIDSHDTVRFVTTAGGDRRRLKMAALFEMCYLGTPHVWYGDEIGMEGQKDPDCRRPFYWTWEQDQGRVDLHDFYRRAIHLRRGHEALRTGDYRVVKAQGADYAFLREGGGETFLVLLHNGAQAATVELDLAPFGLSDETLRCELTSAGPLSRKDLALESGKLSLDMEPLSGIVLKVR